MSSVNKISKTVEQTTILTGEKDKLKDLLLQRLTECGWRDEVRLLCREIIKEKSGKVNVDQLVEVVTPRARAIVPNSVKKELLVKIKTCLANQEGIEL